MFYVLNVSGDRSWILTPEGLKTASKARENISWQARGGFNPADYRVCAYDVRRNRFVSRPKDQHASAHSALVRDQVCTWAPDRGPYTESAFAEFCARLRYNPNADGEG